MLTEITYFSPMFRLPDWLNYKIVNGPPFWVHYTPSNIILEECQVLHYIYRICSSCI